MKKSTRKLKAKETLEIIDNGYYQNEKDNTKTKKFKLNPDIFPPF